MFNTIISKLKAKVVKNRYLTNAITAAFIALFIPSMAFSADPQHAFHLNPEYEESYKYSIGVKAGNFLVIGGVTSVDEEGNEIHAGDPRKQMQVIYERLTKILAAHGATAKNVIKETIYYGIDNERYFSTLDIRADFYKGVAGPSTAGVRVDGFTSENILIEVTAVAYLGD